MSTECEYCVKCDKKVCEESDDGWGYCDELGWFCPAHAPTCPCDYKYCDICYNGGGSESEDESEKFD